MPTSSRCVLLAGLVLAAAPARAQLESQPDFEEQRRAAAAEDPAPSVEPPRLVQQVAPAFPAAALAQGRGGTVLLRITVDEQGQVQRVDVAHSAGPDLDDAALGAACNFTFTPARLAGQPVPSVVDFRQTFTWTEPAPPPAAALPPEPAAAPEPPVFFRGIVRESGTKEPLAEAEVTVNTDDGPPLLATTDGTGHFELRGTVQGKALVHAAHPGHETVTAVEEFRPQEVLEIAYFLPRRSYNKFETLVRDRGATREVTRVAVRREEVNRVPGTLGDPLRAIEMLPSMAQAPLLGGQLLVRGTPPRSTAVYLDGVQIPQLYHFGMLRSVVHPEFLESIDMYPGGFGPEYGRATAGVVDVHSRELTLRGYRGQADVSFLESGFFFGGPVRFPGAADTDGPDPRRLTFAFAARRSYADALVPLVLDVLNPGAAGSWTLAPIYADYQAKLEYRPWASHTFQVLAFGSDDQVRFRVKSQDANLDARIRFQLQFHRLLARWRWTIHPRVHNDALLYGGVDSALLGLIVDATATEGTQPVQARGTVTNNSPVLGLRNQLRYNVAEWLTLVLGVDTSLAFPRFIFDVADTGPGTPSEVTGTTPIRSTRQVMTEQRYNVDVGTYAQVVVQPFPGFTLLPGFRVDDFTYGSGMRAVTPSPRLALRWEVLPHTVLKATTGLYFQAPRAYETSAQVGNPSLQPERSWQTTVGVEQRLAPAITVAINGFLNLRRDLVQTMAFPVNVDVDLGMPLFAKNFDNQSLGRVYGVDLLLRHEITRHFYGWVAYTVSRSEVMKPPDRWWRPFNFDQSHILSVVGQYRMPWHLPFREWARSGRLPHGRLWNQGWSILCGDLSLAARYRYVTGNPRNYLLEGLGLTEPQTVQETPRDSSKPTPVTPSRPPPDGRRHSPFSQLDVRLDYKVSFDLWLATLSLDVLNVTGHTADPDDIPQVPLLPVVSFTAEF